MSRIPTNNKGSVLLTVILVMLVLLVIAVGTVQASERNVVMSKKADNFERLYYGAESAAVSAADTLRKQVAAYYGLMARLALSDYEATGGFSFSYYACKDAFGTAVAANSRAAYTDPDLVTYARGNVSTGTVFSDGTLISETGINPPTYRFTITSAATDAGLTRIFRTYLDVTVKDVEIIPNISKPPNLDVGLAVGGDLYIPKKDATVTVLGDAALGTLTIPRPSSHFYCDNNDTVLNPDIGGELDWHLNFSAMLGAGLAGATDLTPTLSSPANLTLSGYYSGAVIRAEGDVELSGSFINCDIYIGGKGTIREGTGTTLTGCTVYCGSDLYIEAKRENKNDYHVTLSDTGLYVRNNISMDRVVNGSAMEYAELTVVSGSKFVAGGTVNVCAESSDCSYFSDGYMTVNGILADMCLFYGDDGFTLEVFPSSMGFSGVIYTNGDFFTDLKYYNETCPLMLDAVQLLVKGNFLYDPAGWARFDNTIIYDYDIKTALLDQAYLDSVGAIPVVLGPPVAQMPPGGEVLIGETLGETG